MKTIAAIALCISISGCVSLGRVQVKDNNLQETQTVADTCRDEAQNNGYADAMDWIPIAGIELAQQKRQEIFRACVEKRGYVWIPK